MPRIITKVVLDAGHGDIDPATGLYTTAPSKMFKHKDGSVAYEGVINMKMALMAKSFLEAWGYDVIFTRKPNEWEDMSLKNRVAIADLHWEDSLTWSIHNNASKYHNAHGSAVFTSRGFTDSDIVAECVANAMKYVITDVRWMFDDNDGDQDYERDFYMLRKPKGNAILTETEFFDHPKGWARLRDDNFLKRATYASALGVHHGIQLVNLKRKFAT